MGGLSSRLDMAEIQTGFDDSSWSRIARHERECLSKTEPV